MNSILDKYLVNKLISILFQVAMLELQSINNKLVTRKMLQQMSMLNSALNFEFFQSMWQLNVIPKKKESFHSGSKNCFQYTKEQLQPRNFLRNLSVLLIFLEVFFPKFVSSNSVSFTSYLVLQANNYEIVVNFFNISHNLT